MNLKGGAVLQPAPTDPLYMYRTILQIWGEGVYPDERAGELFDFLIVGDARTKELGITLADVQAHNRYGRPKARSYRGVEVPVYQPPPGISIMFPGGGRRHHQTYLPISPQLASDMLAAFTSGAAPYMAIHVHGIPNVRRFAVRCGGHAHPLNPDI